VCVPGTFPGLVGVLAAAGQVGAILVTWIGAARLSGSDSWSDCSQRLWMSGSVAALVALVLGSAADRRGPTIPLALLALVLAVPAYVLAALVSIKS